MEVRSDKADAELLKRGRSIGKGRASGSSCGGGLDIRLLEEFRLGGRDTYTASFLLSAVIVVEEDAAFSCLRANRGEVRSGGRPFSFRRRAVAGRRPVEVEVVVLVDVVD